MLDYKRRHFSEDRPEHEPELLRIAGNALFHVVAKSESDHIFLHHRLNEVYCHTWILLFVLRQGSQSDLLLDLLLPEKHKH